MLHKVTTVQNVFQFSSMHMHVYSRVTQVCSSDSLLVCQLTNLTIHLRKEYLKWLYFCAFRSLGIVLVRSCQNLYQSMKLWMKLAMPIQDIHVHVCRLCICWFVCLLVCWFVFVVHLQEGTCHKCSIPQLFCPYYKPSGYTQQWLILNTR